MPNLGTRMENTERACEICAAITHATDQCPTFYEDVNAMGGHTYNPA